MKGERRKRARVRLKLKDYLAVVVAALQTTLLPFILLLMALMILALVFAIL